MFFKILFYIIESVQKKRVPISCDICTLVTPLLSLCFNHPIFIAIIIKLYIHQTDGYNCFGSCNIAIEFAVIEFQLF